MARKPYLTFLKFFNYVMLSSKSSNFDFSQIICCTSTYKRSTENHILCPFWACRVVFSQKDRVINCLFVTWTGLLTFGWATVNKTNSSNLGFTLSPSWSTALLQDCFIIIYQRIIVINIEFIMN